jgi:hypothetical protein
MLLTAKVRKNAEKPAAKQIVKQIDTIYFILLQNCGGELEI